MKTMMTAVLIAIPLVIWASSQDTQSPEPVTVGGKITWVYDYQDAQRISQQTGKPMFVVFRCER